jgi:hypothetical protein
MVDTFEWPAEFGASAAATLGLASASWSSMILNRTLLPVRRRGQERHHLGDFLQLPTANELG